MLFVSRVSFRYCLMNVFVFAVFPEAVNHLCGIPYQEGGSETWVRCNIFPTYAFGIFKLFQVEFCRRRQQNSFGQEFGIQNSSSHDELKYQKKEEPGTIFFNTIILEPITDCSAGPLKRILQLNLVFIVKLHRGMVWHQPSLISASEAKELFECKKFRMAMPS